MAQASTAVKSLSAFQEVPCSQEHIMHMRKTMFQAVSIDKVVYFKDGLIKCSSWGVADEYAGDFQVDFVTPDGVMVAIK
ncbi:CSS-motif domain-containing protein, partial [Klebsiella pneumoniae]|uniref:CSS-motif domain-containing protein n=1 Tax=Klebsiella pneumoniae TaxID=573 RepID=UPI001D0ECEDA